MINKQAEVLFSTLDLVPGFDIKSTVETLGGEIRVKKELEENIEAQICPKEDSEIGFLIECKNNYDNDDYYIRFSIAHELGHLFLHMASPDNEKGYKLIGNYHKGSQNASIKEWEAEEFAASFLMPESRFRIEVEAARFNSEVEDKVAQLAKIFKVPYKSVITRGKSLEIW
ncbi:MAG: ImmA/IrrE family metallo-endopeptidase [Lachnospiraceae bacterium]|nr:ImmA/IrrE family metallo-endopeptidase [Lachnospiraceae bacterium]